MTKLIAQYFLNHRLNPEEIEWQIEQIAKAGYEGIYPHARQGLLTPYMSEAWWEVMDVILEGCRQHGMEFWLWDEDYYPSGIAGGRVVWDEPGYIARQLSFETVELKGEGPFEVDFSDGMLIEAFAIRKSSDGSFEDPIKVTSYCGTRRQRWTERQVLHRAYSPQISTIGHPHWRTSMVDNKFALSWKPEQDGEYIIVGVLVSNNQGVHPDILRPEPTKKFIDLSYGEYFKRYGEEFGNIIKGSFSDEPSPGVDCYPWTASFPDEFFNDHQYSITDYLPHLALDLDLRSPLVRHHYRLTQHRLQCQHFIGQISTWCREHKIQMAAHLTRTEWLSLVAAWWPNELRSYKEIDVPCTDPLGASCGWKEASAYHSGIKVASSAAHLFNKPQAGSDSLAVIGDEASIRDLKYLLDYHLVLGVNYFNLHGLSYSLDGPRKDEVPPSLFYQHSEWKYMPVFLDYLGNTCDELTGGTHICQIAVLYPSTSLACQIKPSIDWRYLEEEDSIHRLVEELLSHQKDFDFIDEVTLQESVNEEGTITTPEKYNYLILPYLSYIDHRTAKAILRFANAGGKIIAVGKIPLSISQNIQEPVETWANQTDKFLSFYETPDNNFLAKLPGFIVDGEGKEDIFVLERQKEEGKRTFVFNRREEEFKGEVLGLQLRIPPRGSILLKTSSDSKNITCLPETAVVRDFETVADLSTDWTVEFEKNQVPLNFWHFVLDNEAGQNPFSNPGFDLMQREAEPKLESGDYKSGKSYYCRFMFTGDPGDAKLVIEESSFSDDWKLFVNDTQIENWEQQRVFDCLNWVADISHAIKGGTTPSLNVVRVETLGNEQGIKEIPYLCGSFTCDYRYSHASFPFIKANDNRVTLDNLLPWTVIGYPSFAGTAIYQREFQLTEDQELWIDLGRVEDVATIKIDGKDCGVLPWPPYKCNLGKLSAGKHVLTVEATNVNANRTRLAKLASGLLGPVKLLK
ncbi:MAG: hypothetical protein GX783_10085 [Clostridiales bacterium]|nr:hypothetical protein [Clostridiales bacterium]